MTKANAAPKFETIENAIGRLVLGGIIPQLMTSRNGAALICRTTREVIAPAFRDGSTYKVKSQVITDAIDLDRPYS